VSDEFPFPACKRLKGDVYNRRGGWVGTQRAPRLPDERGAVAVVENVFGGRTVLIPIAGTDYVRVVHIPTG
jgi:hypothetical protein